MEPESLTIAILKEIRDNTAKTNDRLDHLTERVDHLTERVDHLTERVDHLTERVAGVEEGMHGLTARVDAMAATQIRQEVILMRLAEASERHEEGIKTLIRVTDRINDRIDNLVEGALGQTVRDHEKRLRRLEGRND